MTRRAEELTGAHERLLADDPTASADLFRMAHRPLAATVYRQHRAMGITWEDAIDLATDAIVEHVRNPSRYDAKLSGIPTYLAMIAKRDALNLARSRAASEKNRTRFVELTLIDGNKGVESELSRVDAERIVRDHGHEIIREDGDDVVLRLFLSGEDSTEEYARALGLDYLTEGQQRRLVKQRRDKIEKRLQRLGLKL